MMDPLALEQRLNRIEQHVNEAMRDASEARHAAMNAVADTALLRRQLSLLLMTSTASTIIGIIVLVIQLIRL